MLLAFLLFGCIPVRQPQVRVGEGVRVTHRGQASSWAEFLNDASTARLVCIGEQHDDATHHELQHAAVSELISRAQARDATFALGMEMFRRHHQAALDDYVMKEITAAELQLATNWKRTWGFDFSLYAPLLSECRTHGVRVIGLNAPRSLTRSVARHGLASLAPQVRESLPELDLRDAQHRKFFWSVMGFSAHDEGVHGGGSRERLYTAQIIWDETMSSGAAAWLKSAPRSQMVIVAGNGHCHQSAVVSRVARRLRGIPKPRTISVQLLRDEAEALPNATSDYIIRTKM